MVKEISITAMDGMNMGDANGKKQKVKMVHEEAFEKFGIDPSKVYDGTGLKPLSKEWYSEIILKNTHSVDDEYNHDSININMKNRTISLGFNSKEKAEKFMNQFHSNLFKSINRFLIESGKNPKHYERGMILSHELQGTKRGASIVISY